MIVVIDTNIWISFLFGKLLTGLEAHLKNSKIRLVSSDEQIEEIFAVLTRPKISRHLTQGDIKRLNHFFLNKIELVKLQIN